MTRIGLRMKWPSARSDGRETEVKPGNHLWPLILLIAVQVLIAQSAMAQSRGGVFTIHYASFSPFVALLAGVLILMVPRLLNYIVAIYFILIGLIGLFGV